MNLIKKKLKEKFNNKEIPEFVSTIYNYCGRNKIHGRRGNEISLNGSFLKKCTININGKNNKIIFGAGNRLNNVKITLRGDNNIISVGECNSMYNADLWIEDNGNNLSFGNNNIIAGFTHIALIEGCSICFGDNCLFSTNVIFRVGDSHSILSLKTNQRINPSKSITIGSSVWFGNNTTILKGVNILNDTIIATGSIVTSEQTKSNVILGGNPAKIIKEDIYWKNERI